MRRRGAGLQRSELVFEVFDVQPQGRQELGEVGGGHDDPSDDLLRPGGHREQVQHEEFVRLQDHQGSGEDPTANLLGHAGADGRMLEILKIRMSAGIARGTGGRFIGHGKAPREWIGGGKPLGPSPLAIIVPRAFIARKHGLGCHDSSLQLY